MYYGLALVSPYVGMTRFQNGSSNQCISMYMAILSLGNKCSCLKYIEQLIEPSQSAVVIATCSNYFKVANFKQSKVKIVHLLLSSASLAL